MGTKPMAMALRKNHPLFPNISYQIMKYVTSGWVMKLIQRHTETCPANKQSKYKLPKADLYNMEGLLVVSLSFGLCGGCIIVAAPWLKRRNNGWRKNNNNNKALHQKKLGFKQEKRNRSKRTKKSRTAININTAYFVLKHDAFKDQQNDFSLDRTKTETESEIH